MAHRRFKAFSLDEISAVDRPAQKGAKATIIKRDAGVVELYLAKRASDAALADAVEEYLKREFSTDKRKDLADRGLALPDGSFPIENRGDLESAIRAIGRAKDPQMAKSHIIARARALDATSLLPDDWKAAKTIGGDLVMEIARIAPRLLPELLENITKAEEIEEKVTKLADAKLRTEKQKELKIAKAALMSSAWSVLDAASPDDVPSLLRKNFSAYKDHVNSLVLGTTKGDDDMKGIAKALGLADTSTETEILAEITKREAAYKAADQLSKMSGKHKAFMENDKAKMPSGGKDVFQSMSPAERDAHMASNPMGGGDDNADTEKNTIKVDGKLIHKRDVGDAAFSILKAQSESIQKMQDERAVGEIAKGIAPLTHVIGKAEDTAAILHRVETGRSTKADSDALVTMLKSANEVLVKSEKITQEIGGNSTGVRFGKAFDAIAKVAEEVKKKNPTWSIEKCRVEARKQHPELAKEEEEENKAARKAA